MYFPPLNLEPISRFFGFRASRKCSGRVFERSAAAKVGEKSKDLYDEIH